ncbi:hypothetical protein HKX48_003373 [Thoreauomyces humboldtii]|nr:hypothetical protein HKX48_003373 [Thoreauomyces humboldtii]
MTVRFGVRVGTALYRQSSCRVFRHTINESATSPAVKIEQREARRLKRSNSRHASIRSLSTGHSSPSTAGPSSDGEEAAAWVEAGYWVAVRFHDGAVSRFQGVILRDFCRCLACFDPITQQRLNNALAVPITALRPAVLSVEKDTLNIVWATEDEHHSAIPITTLRERSYAPKLPPPVERTVRPRPPPPARAPSFLYVHHQQHQQQQPRACAGVPSTHCVSPVPLLLAPLDPHTTITHSVSAPGR